MLVLPSEHPDSIAPRLPRLPLFCLSLDFLTLIAERHSACLTLPSCRPTALVPTAPVKLANAARRRYRDSHHRPPTLRCQRPLSRCSSMQSSWYRSLTNNGNDCNHGSDDIPHRFSSKHGPRTYILNAPPAMDDWDPIHLHRCWLRHSSPLASPTKVILGDNGNIPAASASCITICMGASRQWTCTVLLDAPQVHNLHGNLPLASHLVPRK